MSDISGQATSFMHDLGDAARRNPLSTALIGMGMAWLFSGRATGAAREAVRRTRIDRLPDAAVGAFDTAGSAVKSVADTVGEFGRGRADALSDYARSLPESGSELMENARDNLQELFRTQPLALGAIGLAIGAGIAAALPTTELEREYLGETSDAVKEKAQEFASDQTVRMKEVAETAITAATEEAARQGLTVEGAKSAASDLSAKVGRVVDAAGKGVPKREDQRPAAFKSGAP
jgi:hypothetical protein